MRRRPLPPEELEKALTLLRRLHDEGATPAEIGLRTGMGLTWARRCMKKLGLALHSQHIGYTKWKASSPQPPGQAPYVLAFSRTDRR